MRKFPKATPAPKPLKPGWLIVPNIYVLALVFLAAWQLITFVDFVPYIASFLGGEITNTTTFAAVVLVALEVFAVPFLLRLQLSPLARICSAAAGLFVPIAWTVVTLANQTLLSAYVPANLLFMVWAAVSFWVLGGQAALRVRL